MKKTLTIGAVLWIGVWGAGIALAADAPESSSTRPPKNLKQAADGHWTAWDPPAATPESYIIQKGDTLWDLAGQWLQNPYLWPQVWEQNRYILDSHWIYPGDPLVVPGKPTVVPPEGPPAGEEMQGMSEEEETAPVAEETPAPAEEAPAPRPLPLVPLADASDLYCSGYIETDHADSDTWIAGREMERQAVGEGDVIYLNRGRSQGISAGQQFAVIRRSHEMLHPVTGASLGHLVLRLGKIRVLAAQENTATAVIQMSCDTMMESDEIVAWTDIPAPMVRSMPHFDRYDAEPSGGEQGYVVGATDDRLETGTGHVIFLDLGAAAGVKPGTLVTLYRDNPELPRLMLGRAVVLTVGDATSVAKIVQSVREVRLSDRAEVYR